MNSEITMLLLISHLHTQEQQDECQELAMRVGAIALRCLFVYCIVLRERGCTQTSWMKDETSHAKLSIPTIQSNGRHTHAPRTTRARTTTNNSTACKNLITPHTSTSLIKNKKYPQTTPIAWKKEQLGVSAAAAAASYLSPSYRSSLPTASAQELETKRIHRQHSTHAAKALHLHLL